MLLSVFVSDGMTVFDTSITDEALRERLQFIEGNYYFSYRVLVLLCYKCDAFGTKNYFRTETNLILVYYCFFQTDLFIANL